MPTRTLKLMRELPPGTVVACQLNVEMAYDDYDPENQTTPSRLEHVIYPSRERAELAINRAREMVKAHRYGQCIWLYANTNLVVVMPGQVTDDLDAAGTLALSMLKANYDGQYEDEIDEEGD